jgi:hypothetical protein
MQRTRSRSKTSINEKFVLDEARVRRFIERLSQDGTLAELSILAALRRGPATGAELGRWLSLPRAELSQALKALIAARAVQHTRRHYELRPCAAADQTATLAREAAAAAGPVPDVLVELVLAHPAGGVRASNLTALLLAAQPGETAHG